GRRAQSGDPCTEFVRGPLRARTSPRLSVHTPGKYSHTGQGRTERDCEGWYTVQPAGATPDACEQFRTTENSVPYCQLRERGSRLRCDGDALGGDLISMATCW